MKATGIIRRLDDLGRLVITKEIRKQYRLKEGDSIEFYIENDKIILQKYELLDKHMREIQDMCETLQSVLNKKVLFIKDEVTGTQQPCAKSLFSHAVVYRDTPFTKEKIFENDASLYDGCFFPVVVESYWQGSFVLLSNEPVDVKENRCVAAFAQLLSRKYEV